MNLFRAACAYLRAGQCGLLLNSGLDWGRGQPFSHVQERRRVSRGNSVRHTGMRKEENFAEFGRQRSGTFFIQQHISDLRAVCQAISCVLGTGLR